MGTKKAAVLPDPVRAMATTSAPERMSGIVLRWIGVGMRYPFRLTPLKTLELRFRDSNPPDFAFFSFFSFFFSSVTELTRSLPIEF